MTIAVPARLFEFDDWSRDSDGALSDSFDTDFCRPSVYELTRAFQDWTLFQNRDRVTVAECAAAWNLPPRRVAEAIVLAGSQWISLSSDGDDYDYDNVCIELDGE